jgi:gliding motility-associated-like protein
MYKDSSSATDGISAYLWSFDDGETASIANPTHYFPSSGNYFTSLTVVSNFGCRDSITSLIPVQIVSAPNASITGLTAGCVPFSTTFSAVPDDAEGGDIQWQWNFGNGSTSTLSNPPAQLYNAPGTYQITLIATNTIGCLDTIYQSVTVAGRSIVNAGVDTFVCKGSSIELKATGADFYRWTAASTLGCDTCATTIVAPLQDAKYVVTGTSLAGCSSSDSVWVTVQQKMPITASSAKNLCIGSSATLSANGAAKYRWSPSIGLSTSTTSTVIVKPDFTTTYQVIGSDAKGCFSDTVFIPVKVYAYPTVDAGQDLTITAGQTADLNPEISADVTRVIWTPTSAIFRNTYPGLTVKPTQTTDYVIEVENAGGCIARDQVRVSVGIAKANVFMPNAFSPNGDGINDVFYPRGTGIYKVRSMRIFNRWGEVVFEKGSFNANDINSGWNGRNKGKLLNPDTYIYTLDIIADNSSLISYKGDITIIN